MTTPVRTGSRARSFAAVLSCAAVVLAGCSGDDKKSDGTSGGKSKDEKSSSSTTIAQASAKVPLDELLTKDLQWATYYEAVVTTQAKETLAGKGPFTVLVPASESFGEAGVAGLGESPQELADSVRRHIIEGELTLADIAAQNGKTLTASSGEELPVAVADGGVTVGGVKILKSDISSKNGVIHVVEGAIPAPADTDTES